MPRPLKVKLIGYLRRMTGFALHAAVSAAIAAYRSALSIESLMRRVMTSVPVDAVVLRELAAPSLSTSAWLHWPATTFPRSFVRSIQAASLSLSDLLMSFRARELRSSLTRSVTALPRTRAYVSPFIDAPGTSKPVSLLKASLALTGSKRVSAARYEIASCEWEPFIPATLNSRGTPLGLSC